jgi:putative copper export protein
MAREAAKERAAALARRSLRLRRVLVAGGVALATACAGMQKGGQGGSSGANDAGSASSAPRSGGGASGW